MDLRSVLFSFSNFSSSLATLHYSFAVRYDDSVRILYHSTHFIYISLRTEQGTECHIFIVSDMSPITNRYPKNSFFSVANPFNTALSRNDSSVLQIRSHRIRMQTKKIAPFE